MMKSSSIFFLVVVSCYCSLVASSSSSPILERLARIRTKTSPSDQKDAVYSLIDRLFQGRRGDFVLAVNQSHFALKHNMDAFEYESSSDGMFYYYILFCCMSNEQDDAGQFKYL